MTLTLNMTLSMTVSVSLIVNLSVNPFLTLSVRLRLPRPARLRRGLARAFERAADTGGKSGDKKCPRRDGVFCHPCRGRMELTRLCAARAYTRLIAILSFTTARGAAGSDAWPTASAETIWKPCGRPSRALTWALPWSIRQTPSR